MKSEDLVLRNSNSLPNLNVCVLFQLLQTVQSGNVNLNVSDVLPIRGFFVRTSVH